MSRASSPPVVRRSTAKSTGRSGSRRRRNKSARKGCGARFQRACFSWHVGNVPHIPSGRPYGQRTPLGLTEGLLASDVPEKGTSVKGRERGSKRHRKRKD